MPFDREYIDWNHKRIKKIIDYFGHESFFNKNILDLGCGHGDIGGALTRLGACVTGVDARKEHLEIAKIKYPHLNTICYDLDKSWPFGNKIFDFVLNLGLICHLSNYEQVIRKSCSASDFLILEMEICDSNDIDRIIRVSEHRSIYDWSFNGIGTKPSASNVEKILTECGMNFERLDVPELNSGPYKYDWKVNNTHNRKIGYRRLWVAQRNKNIIMPSSPLIMKSSGKLTIPRFLDTSVVSTNIPNLGILKTINQGTKEKYNSKPEYRVAVCISGHLRNFEKTFDKLFCNLLKSTKPDIFIHTWDVLGAPKRGYDGKVGKIYTHGLMHRINKLFKPIKIIVEPHKQFPIHTLMHSKNFENRDINGLLSMFYKIQQCNQLKINYEKEHDFKYDCVIRLRPDLMFMSPFYITPALDTKKIHIPVGYDYGGINDQVAYGSSELMDIYSDTFSQINRFLIEGVSFNPERLLHNHLTNHNIPIVRCKMHYYIKRAK